MEGSRCGGVHDSPVEHLCKNTSSVSHSHNGDIIVPPPSNPKAGDSEIDHVVSASELSLPPIHVTTVAVGAIHGVADGKQSQLADSIVNSVVSGDNSVIMPSTSSHDVKSSEPTLPLPDADHVVLPCEKIISSMIESPKSGRSTPKKEGDLNRGHIDTASHFESVTEAGSKFGGIVRRKSCRTQFPERRRYTGQDLEKLQEEMVVYKKRCVDVEEAKIQVLKVIDSTNREINELKLSLERAQTEEKQAKQDSAIAMLREEEMEQGICDEASVAAKQQLEVAKASHAAAVEELKSINEELETLRQEYVSMVTERDMAVKKAEEAVSASKEVDKRVEELTFDLMATKEYLGSANAVHVAEEKRIGAVNARYEDTRYWEENLKQAEEELQKFTQQIQSAEGLKPTLDTASVLLHDLKAELTAYTESKVNLENNGHSTDASGTSEKRTLTEIPVVVASAKKEIEEVKLKIENTAAEVDSLKVLAVSLKSELEKEECALATIKQTEGISKDDPDNSESKIASAQMNGKGDRDKMVEVPKQLQQATQEALEAKSLTETASKELRKVKEEAEQAKTRASTMESRLHAVQKEIEASEASKKLALDAIKALQDHESAQRSDNDNLRDDVILPLEEYYDLSKRAYEAEEQAHMKLAAVISQVEVGKRSQSSSLEELEEANREMAERNEQLKTALEKAEKAKEGKLIVEQELRQWRAAEHEQQRKATESSHEGNPPMESFEGNEQTKKAKTVSTSPCNTLDSSKAVGGSSTKSEWSPETMVVKKKKKQLFSKIVTFFNRKKSSLLKFKSKSKSRT